MDGSERQLREQLREQLAEVLGGGYAHVEYEAELIGFPVERAGERVAGIPHTAWQLLEHLRISQWDILEFCRDRNHKSPEYPDGYWPESEAPPSPTAWASSAKEFLAHLRGMIELARDTGVDLHAQIPWGDGQTILRELLVSIDHNAYHLGQIVQLRLNYSSS